MTPVSRIAEIRKRLEAATPGKWGSHERGFNIDREYEIRTESGGALFRSTSYGKMAEDAEFISHAPTDIAFLLEQLDLIPTILKKYNIDHFGKCSVRHKLPCSCGRDEAVYKLKRLFGDDEVK